MSSFGGILSREPAPPPAPPPPTPGSQEAAARELQKVGSMARRGSQVTILLSLVLVLSLVGGVVVIGRCANANVMRSHLGEATNEYIKRIKTLGKCGGPQHFESSSRLMDHVIELQPQWPEPYVYKASAYVIGYGSCIRSGKKYERAWLDTAHEYCDTALKCEPDYAPAHYYKALAFYFQGKKECFDYLDKVLETSERYYDDDDPARVQWKERVEGDRAKIKKDGRRAKIDTRPIKAMMPAFELVN